MPFLKGHKSGMTGRKHSKETINLMKINARYGKNNPRWNGGETYKDGYLMICMPFHPNKNATGYVAKHRLVIEKKIGRFLNKNENVHHVNGNKSDNRCKNLVIVDRKKHMELHREILNDTLRVALKKRRKRTVKKCIRCNDKFLIRPCEDHVFCSRHCYHVSIKGKEWHKKFKQKEKK